MKYTLAFICLFSSTVNAEQCLKVSNNDFVLNKLPKYKTIKFSGGNNVQVIEMRTDSRDVKSWAKLCGFDFDPLHHGGSILEQYFSNSSIGIIILEDGGLVRVAVTSGP